MESAFKDTIEFRILNIKAIFYFQTLENILLGVVSSKANVFFDGNNIQCLKLSEI